MSLEQNVNKALVLAGNKGKYQYVVVFLLCVIFYFDLFMLLGNSFYFMDPTFICDGSDEIVDEKQACPKIEQCHITNDFTITKYMGLYCGRQSERELIQSLLSIGSLIGLIVMNFLSDLKGRKLALIIDLILAALSTFLTILGAYTQITGILVIASVLGGFSGYSLVIICYILAGDICEQEMRQKSSLYMNLSYSLGLVTFFIFYNWINEWYNILILFMFIPFLGLSIICFILIQQSPNFYLCKKHNKKQCIETLTNIAIYNGKSEEDIGEIQKIISQSNFEPQSIAKQQTKGFLSVLKQWKFLKIILLVAITQSGGNLFFYGIEYAIDDIGFNFGVDNLVLGSTEIVTTLIMTNFVNKLKRKKTIFISYGITVAVAFLFVFSFVQNSNVFCTILIIAIRALTTIAYFMIVMIQTESFPLQIQSVGAGSIEALAQLGSFSAPLIIDFAINHGFEKMATLAVVLLVLLAPLKFVPQPSGHHPKQDDLHQSLLESQVQTANQ